MSLFLDEFIYVDHFKLSNYLSCSIKGQLSLTELMLGLYMLCINTLTHKLYLLLMNAMDY